jgi:hypothetical protein
MISNNLRVSPRHLGQMTSPNACKRCIWYLIGIGFQPPFAFPMPGLMHNLDRFEKRIVEAHFTSKGRLPKWLSSLGCTEPVEFPAKMQMDFPSDGITLVGMPDAVFRLKDGGLYLVDYKSARCKGDDDPFMATYVVQLLGYATLLEHQKIGKVRKAALVYFENQLFNFQDEPLGLLSDEGLMVPFAVKIHEVELDRQSFEPMVKQYRELADMSSPPAGRDGCKDCAKLEKLFEIVKKVKGGHAALADAALRDRQIFNSILQSITSARRSDVIDASRRCFDQMDDVDPFLLDSTPSPSDL